MEIETILSVPAVIALVEAVKYTQLIDDRFIPILAIGFGVVLGFFVATPLVGLAIGLSASGLYSGVKHVYKGMKEV